MKIKKFYAFISILLADCYHTQKAASFSDAKCEVAITII